MLRGKTLPAIIKAYRKYNTLELSTKEIIKMIKSEIDTSIKPSTIYSALSRNLIHVRKGVWKLPLEYYIKGVNANYINKKELEKEYQNIYNIQKYKEKEIKKKSPMAFKSKKIPKSAMSEKVKFIYYMLNKVDSPELLEDLAEDIVGKEYDFYNNKFNAIKEFANDIGVEVRKIDNEYYGITDKENGEEWVFRNE